MRVKTVTGTYLWSFFRAGAVSSWHCSGTLLCWGILGLVFLSAPTLALADDPPPQPSSSSTLGQTVTNPVTAGSTTVSKLLVDPADTPTAGTTAFVQTADGYTFLVKAVGETVYNGDAVPVAFTIESKDTTAHTVHLLPVIPDPDPAKNGRIDLGYQLPTSDPALQALFFPPSDSDGTVTVPDVVAGAAGVRNVLTGNGGSNGRAGALFVPPSSGGSGSAGPANPVTNATTISTANQIGIEAGSIGGAGGKGGGSYLSFWSGRDGGNGGAGGTVSVTNNSGVQVATTGTDKYGIFAYSRSGKAGDGGTGWAAPGGGTGGHSSNGGSVTVNNWGSVITKDTGAYGIYGLSVSNNGGNGGSQWGLVGISGAGGYGGSGGAVAISNESSGDIYTSGSYAHGIVAQSIGGSGGSSGTSGNLLLSLNGSPDNGGNGGPVTVSNDGTIATTGDDARGIVAQSIGGGGGSGGSSGGLIALGGAGSNGGSAGTVTVNNTGVISTGKITTTKDPDGNDIITRTGLRSDGIFAQSSGGSGGSGSDAGGLFAIGGRGSKAGSGDEVTVVNSGDISTKADSARGIVAQSIGGGGGDGGNSSGLVSVGGSGDGGGIGKKVTVTNGGSITTQGDDAKGVFAQSVGGGGGNGGSAGSVGLFAGVAVGGTAGGGGAGGNVDVTLQGKDANSASLIRTEGDRSTGLFAQSVGGGGGTGGGAVQVSAGFGAAASFAVGGQGGKGGAGGTVTMEKGTGLSIIETTGNDSEGAFLQSVGGGGGNGGYAVAVAVSGGPVAGSLSVAIGGNGSAGGAGGQLTVGTFDAAKNLTATGFNGSILTTGERSTGFLAQSVGGGGGNGGLAVSAAGSGSLLFSGSIAIGLGGNAGGGGDGGIVEVGTQGNITTGKAASTGLLVQSVGGGGGNGGGSIAASIAGSGVGAGTIGVAIGGNAEKGGIGGQVTAATRSGTITTGGENSTGIIVQSVGGGGGNGGYSIGAGGAGAGVGAGAVNVGLGGKGGGGGAGGTVKADLQSDVNTAGQNSSAIVVQSVGGGGGNGGFNVSAGGAVAGVGSGAVSVGLGGKGATGGLGGTVNAASTGTITTTGDRSAGFVAQSIGGGGGNGGFNISASGSGAGVGSGAVSVGLGGTAGPGNYGGEVTAGTSVGRIKTEGDESVGILAQSVGGGGGNGGFNVSGTLSGAGVGSGAVSVGLGGGGGAGGVGKTVILTVENDVTTLGNSSTAVIAQSIGGGGGNGGFNVSGSGSGAGVGSGAISVGVGGSGAGGGDGGAVTASVTGVIETGIKKAGSDGTLVTSGNSSIGILAQSIGGGGGNGGFNIAASLSGAGVGSGGIAVGLGGSGAGGGNGSTVELTVPENALTAANSVTTHGRNAAGIIAQSIGGGGGNGGFDVTATLSGAGTGSGTVGVSLGGSAGAGGNGGAVTTTITSSIATGSDNSAGLLVQSLGGGGGNGGFSVSGALSGAGTGSGGVAVAIGGSGGDGGHSNVVTSSYSGNVTTSGKNSTGIIAQSLGGGGGNGGMAVSGALSAAGTGSGAVSVGVGGSGGKGGNSVAADNKAVVDNKVTGDIVTTRDSSGGVLAQSIGGGGGNGGISVAGAVSLAGSGSGAVSVGIGGSGGEGGSSGQVINSVTGNVYTSGNDSFGIAAQSIGGGGGNGGLTINGAITAAKSGAGALGIGIGGAGGGGGDAVAALNVANVDNTVEGYVQTRGNHATGILAQSLGGGGGNGGLTITGVITASQEGSGGLAVGVGGLGGDGGNANSVKNRVTGGVVTTGEDSDAIVAQSLGGGGGNGAINVTGAVNLSKDGGGTLGVGIGGLGGDGGNAGNVTSTVTTTVDHNLIGTTGDNSSAVIVQSNGGGGGNGGLNVTGAINLSGKNGAAIGVGVGGFGGSGGRSGDVQGEVNGTVLTGGSDANAIVIQSLGGGGGNGGLNVTGGLGISTGGKTGQASIGIGGFGGDGGSSGTASLLRIGNTQTTGANSQGIIVQSLAGGGGNGGINVSGGLALSSSDNASINVGIGGFGGKASDAGTASATIIGSVSATGLGTGPADQPDLFSGAVVVQSVGGGGGNGGLNVSGGISLTKSDGSGKAASIGIGGFGGDGGGAGDVNLSIYAPGADRVSVVAAGDNRAAVIAQSLGGGGGLGGISVTGGIASSSALAFGIGGFGGGGGVAGEVTANVNADIQAKGDGSRGLFAQSLGGGGGAGGINVAGTANINSKDDTSITFGMGGFGGAGNISGNVDVTQKGTVIVEGRNAIGIVAQSIAGGGGDGGLNVSVNIANAASGKSTNRIIAGVGGTAGTGADAGGVTLNSVGLLLVNGPASTSTPDDPGDRTTVFNAGGILAQSIGGGGGIGGMNITSSVARNAGNTLQFGMGGNGGAGGNAGTVTVTRGYELSGAAEIANASILTTIGDYNNGLVAQSIGGGGGMGGMNFNFAYNQESKPDDGKKYKAALLTVGGSGADAGNGDLVTVRQNGEIQTDGAYSHGLIAQSIGGGGGSSNANLGAGKLGDKTMGFNIGVGGANGAAGNGGDVDVDQIGRIVTRNDSSIGIKAQSIGGGGGSANGINQYVDPVLDFVTGQLDDASVAINIGRSGGTGGTGGAVAVKSGGTIDTSGSASIGILAQSIGGGGGDSGTTTVGGDYKAKSGTYGGNIAVGLEGGEAATGGTVTVTTNGEIVTAGERAHAIFAQSLGGGGGMGGTVGDKLALSTGEDEDTTTAKVTIGGKGGTGSYSQQVSVDNSAMLLTGGDRSSGIWAQSIGGTGGTGGDYLQASIENIKGGKTSRSFSVNVGGTGGTGAVGGGVTVTSSGVIQTAGLQSFGIRAESIGGGGGDGGAVSQGTLLTGTGSKQSVDINVGGSGGEGGKAGLVSVTNRGTILTEGYAAEGIRATSTGGGGGNAGVMLSTLLKLTGSESQTQAVTMNFGGSGGTGGTGGDVSVSNVKSAIAGSGTIQTLGDAAHGIFAQSLGGGGGNGSSVISMTALRSTQDSVSIGLSIGGTGGSGNTAGVVTVDNSGSISTSGQDAYGILAQSVGGGGGNGGLVMAASAAFGKKANAPVLAIGGFGGDGGNGGKVTVTNSGTIYTTGRNGQGIVAQSIGGGGGNAGVGLAATNDAASFAISNLMSLIAGATGGGKGGTGGEVDVVQTGDITVTGAGAQAIVAESINGGGGRLNFDLSGVVGMPGFSFKSTFKDIFGFTDDEVVVDPKIATRLGGSDLTSMNAGKVTVTSNGSFVVAGSNGVASFDQSVGGGGGSLYLTSQQIDASSLGDGYTPTPIAYQVNLGGTNLIDSSGGDITNSLNGGVMTAGINSVGVLSQSIGGGGGHAIVDITAEAGALVGPIDVTLGSMSGSNLSGGAISRRQVGSVTTNQELSTAVLLQSIGGGGGSTSIVVHGSTAPETILTQSSGDGVTGLNRVKSLFTPVVAAVTPPVATSSLSLGAAGGSGLDGGDVDSTFTGGISTAGNHATGLFAQSIGAGGGEVRLSGAGALNVALGGTDAASGNGGNVVISNSGDILTSGAAANGVFLQSIGGGGGAVFTDITDPRNINLTLHSGNSGNGGNISFTQNGDVIVSGERSIGVLAQSIGGGGGFVDTLFMGTAGGAGSGGAVSVNAAGSIIADGANSIAVVAQSAGGGGAGDITVTIMNAEATEPSIIKGGSGQGTGISILGGANNQLNNDGVITSAPGIDGYAIRGTSGNDHINNRGVIIGSIDLGSGSNSVTNRTDTLLQSGAAVNLGAGGVFTNEGVLSPGGHQRVLATSLTGNLVQSASGTYQSDLDLKNATSDQLNITGSANLAGVLNVTMIDPAVAPAFARSGTHDLVIISAPGGGTRDRLTLNAPLRTAVASYALINPNATDTTLRYVIEYAPAGLTSNQRAVGNAVNLIQSLQASPAFGPIATNLFYQPEVSTLSRGYTSLSGEGTSAFLQTGLWAGEQFLTSITHRTAYWLSDDKDDPNGRAFYGDTDLIYAQLGTPDVATDGNGSPRAASRRWRAWLTGVGSNATYHGTTLDGSAQTEQHGGGFSMGLDYQLSKKLLVGLSGGRGQFNVRVPDRETSGRTDVWHIASYAALRHNRFYATGSVAYDDFDNDMSRHASLPGTTAISETGETLTIPGFDEHLSARFDGYAFSGYVETGYRYPVDPFELTPFIGVQFGSLHTNSFTETSQGLPSSIGLSYQDRTTQSVPTLLGMQVKTVSGVAPDIVVTGWASAAWKHEFERERSTESAFIAAPGANFIIQGAKPPQDSLRGRIGVNLAFTRNASLFGNFDCDYAGTGHSYSGSGGFNISW